MRALSRSVVCVVARLFRLSRLLFTRTPQIMMTTASKELGQRLNIRVAPSFLFYRNGEQVAFVTGTKEEELRSVLDQHH